MRILFLESHPMWIHGLPNGFKDLRHEIKVSGPLTQDNIPILIAEFMPDLIVTIGWTNENTGKKVDWIRKYVKPSKIPHIYWATEDPAYTHCFTLPLIQKILPDFVFTICSERVDYYKKLGIKAAYMGFAYHESVHYRVDPDAKYRCSLAVVANAYPKFLKDNPECFRAKSLRILINPILKTNMRIDFWGRNWDAMNPFVEYEIPSQWMHGYLDYTEANKIYSSADIVIGLQNRQITQRTFEILGSEGFLLTNDTSAVKQYFTHGKDLILSSSPKETLELVDYYLKNPEDREKIRKQGKISAAKYTYRHNAKYIIEVLKEHKVLPYNLE